MTRLSSSGAVLLALVLACACTAALGSSRDLKFLKKKRPPTTAPKEYVPHDTITRYNITYSRFVGGCKPAENLDITRMAANRVKNFLGLSYLPNASYPNCYTGAGGKKEIFFYLVFTPPLTNPQRKTMMDDFVTVFAPVEQRFAVYFLSVGNVFNGVEVFPPPGQPDPPAAPPPPPSAYNFLSNIETATNYNANTSFPDVNALQAIGFTAPSNVSAIDISYISCALYQGGADATVAWQLSLHPNDGSINPPLDTTLGTVSRVIFSDAPDISYYYRFTPGGPISSSTGSWSITPGQKYWIVMRVLAGSSSSAAWLANDPWLTYTSSIGVEYSVLSGNRVSPDGGATWFNSVVPNLMRIVALVSL